MSNLSNDKVGDGHSCVKFCPFSEQLLSVSSQDSLAWAEGFWVEYDWGLGQWHVWAVEVSAVHVAVALVSHEDLTLWEQWILIQSPTIVDCANILDAE